MNSKGVLVRLCVLSLAVAAMACSSRDGEPPIDPPPAQPAPPTVSLGEFRQLQWIAGAWRGSGGAYPSFFEEYRVIDDSTIQMRAFSDSTFATSTDSSWIELRNGSVGSRGGSRAYVAIAFSADSIRFAQAGDTQGGHTFSRTSADEWKATLHPSRAGGEATVYAMRRIQRPSR